MMNVLWTGGWDSTFRVLDLTVNRRMAVQPYYIKDKGRKSTPVEISTMAKIKAMLMKMDPAAGALLKDPILFGIDDIPPCGQITRDYQYLLSKSYLGSQYEWLARFAKAVGPERLELCIHRDDKAEGFIKDDVTLTEDQGGPFYVLKDSPSAPELRIFQYYHFPLLDKSKLAMGQIAKQSGFGRIMEQTWFCFNPQKNGKPCGQCNPCKYTRDEGLGRRVPNPSLLARIKKFLAAKRKPAKRPGRSQDL